MRVSDDFERESSCGDASRLSPVRSEPRDDERLPDAGEVERDLVEDRLAVRVSSGDNDDRRRDADDGACRRKISVEDER